MLIDVPWLFQGLGSAGYFWKLNKLIIVSPIGLVFSSWSKFGIKEEGRMNIAVALSI